VAFAFDAELILFHVAPGYAEVIRAVTPSSPAPTTAPLLDATLTQQTVEAAASAGRLYLQSVAARIQHNDHPLRQVVAQGSPARTILEFCEAEDVSLVAMCTHGHSGLVRTFLGSVADEVMRESRRPVLMLRPDAA
jgi:nucleotide-binding universal stress UspA family protein